MSIYIKGVELPTSCYSCPFENGGDCYGGKHKRIMDVDDDEELFRSSRHPDCPLVYIPEPHGRLIDADEVDWVKYNQDVGYLTQYQQGWNDGVDRTLREIDDAPTVIEAEDGEGK